MSEVSSPEEYEFSLPLVRSIASWAAYKIEAKVAEISKKAVKYGLPPFVLTVVREYMVPKDLNKPRGIQIEMVEYSIAGVQIKVDGHRMVGRVDFEDGEILVSSRPGDQIPTSYRCATPMCDHCRLDRKRSSVFVFRRDDESCIQVGRSCMKDFLGYDPAAALWAASMMTVIDDEFDEPLGSVNHSERISVVEIMNASAYAVRVHGFTSVGTQRNKALDGIHVTATRDDVMNILFPPRNPPKGYVKPVILEDDIAKAAAVIEWIETTWGVIDEPSDYQFNALSMIRMSYVATKRIGILCSLIATYGREMEKNIERSKMVNAYVGTVGDRREFKAVYAGENSFQTDFGTLFIARFRSDDGLLVYKGGSPWWPTDVKAGDEVVFVGSIKEHALYNGTCQTLVARCKIGPIPVKVKKSKKLAPVEV